MSDSLTIEKLRESMDRLGLPLEPFKHWGHTYGMYYGMPVYEEPIPPPKIQLSENAPVSEEFRRECNARLLERFGRKDPLLKGDQFIVSQEMGFIVAPPGGAYLLANITA